MSEPAGDRTISESVMGILESFSDAEPKCFIAVWLDEAGDVAMNRTHARSAVEAMGLLEAAKVMVGHGMMATPPSDESKL